MKGLRPLKGQRFLKDSSGAIVVAQAPNVPLLGWIICTVLSFVITAEPYGTGFGLLARAFLFTWAYLEVTDGVNYFRRLLGLLVLLAVSISMFM